MKQSNTYSNNLSFALLLVGEPKTGKTTVTSAFPRPYYLDFDRNLGSLVGRFPNRPFAYDNPYEADDGKEIDPLEVWEININQRLKTALASPDIDTIVIDSLSTMCDNLMYHIFKLVKRQEGKTIDTPRIQDYGTFRTLMIRLISYLRKQSKNIIFTAHQKIDKDELTGIINYRLNIPGQLADNFGGFFSDVWACTTKPGARGPTYSIATSPIFKHVELGHSFKIEHEYNVTDKTPDEIWKLFEPTFTGRKNVKD
jgi:GTPase SAR1 family protein